MEVIKGSLNIPIFVIVSVGIIVDVDDDCDANKLFASFRSKVLVEALMLEFELLMGPGGSGGTTEDLLVVVDFVEEVDNEFVFEIEVVVSVFVVEPDEVECVVEIGELEEEGATFDVLRLLDVGDVVILVLLEVLATGVVGVKVLLMLLVVFDAEVE